MKEETEKDEILQAIIKAKKSGQWPSELNKYEPIQNEISYQKGLLLRENRIMLPKCLQEQAIQIAHECHPGIMTMKRLLRRHFWWSGMDLQIIRKVEQCKDCIFLSKSSPPAPIKRTPLPQNNWEFVAIDFYSAQNPKLIILVLVDYFSRYTTAKFIKTEDFRSTTEALEEIFYIFGYPRKMIADNGPPFQGTEFANWCRKRSIKLVHSTPLWPRQNGMVERFMPNLKRTITYAITNGQCIKTEVKKMIFNYNRRPHATTNEPPMKIMFGREITDIFPSTIVELHSDFIENDELDRMIISDNLNKEKGKLYSDKFNKAKESTIQVGDTVVIKNQNKSKLTPSFGPKEFTVIRKSGNELQLKDDNGSTLLRNATLTKKLPQSSTKDGVGEGVPDHTAHQTPSPQLQDNTTELTSSNSGPGIPSRRSQRIKDYTIANQH